MLKWSSLNKILLLNYLVLSFLWNAYSTNPSKQYLYLKMTPKGSVSVTRNNKPASRLTCVSYWCFLSLSLMCEFLCRMSLVFVIIMWLAVACQRMWGIQKSIARVQANFSLAHWWYTSSCKTFFLNLPYRTCLQAQKYLNIVIIVFSARRAAKEAKEAPAQPAPVSTVVCMFWN